MAKAKVGLVLGGGGARGLAHIGIIKKLEEYGIPIDVVTGASMGAVIGAAYAQNPDILSIEKKFRDFFTSPKFHSLKAGAPNFNKVEKPENFIRYISNIVKRRIIINLAANRKSLIDAERLRIALEHLLPDGLLEDTQIPFACTALDLISGHEVVFRKGNVHKAIKASSSIPGFLPPFEDNSKLLVDGAVIDNFPIKTTRELGAEFLIVCNVSPPLEQTDELNNVIDIFIRAHHATAHKLNILLMQESNIILEPELGDINWTEFEHIDQLIKKGEEIVDKNIHRIKLALKTFNRYPQKIKRWSVRMFNLK